MSLGVILSNIFGLIVVAGILWWKFGDRIVDKIVEGGFKNEEK